jgi:transposase
VTVLDADGQVRDSRQLSTERATLLGYFGKVPRPAKVAVEATFNWYYFLDLVEPLGLELHLVNPYKTRAMASARIKHDKLDSRTLAVLLRLEGIAEAYIAPLRCGNFANCSAIGRAPCSGRPGPRTPCTGF